MTSRTNRPRAALVSLLAASLILAGCASSPSELEPTVADALQASVVDVATLAADSDVAGAIEQLDALQKTLDNAVAAQDLSAQRANDIQDAIDLVRIDLKNLLPEPSPTPTQPDVKPGKPGKNDEPGKGDKPKKP